LILLQKSSNSPPLNLRKKYPPSEPCSCDVCRSYCERPGWWTVKEAENAIREGLAGRMMLEISPERDFGVLSPAFRGNEGNYALQDFAKNGCTFLGNELCELFGTGLQPLECRFCHHDRAGQGITCHREIEKEWNTPFAKRVIVRWGNLTGFWERQGLKMVEK
jgi:hypothetical protein